VTAGHEHGREGALPLGKVQDRRHVVIGTALINHLLDAEPVALQGADDARVERRLLGEAAQRLDELQAQEFLAALQLRLGLDRGHRLAARVELLRAFSLKGGVEHFPRLVFGLEDREVVRLDRKERRKHKRQFSKAPPPIVGSCRPGTGSCPAKYSADNGPVKGIPGGVRSW